MDNCHLFVELNLISKIFGHAALVSNASFNGCTSFNKPCSEASPVAACFKMLKFGLFISAFKSMYEPSSFLVKNSALLHNVATCNNRLKPGELAS